MGLHIHSLGELPIEAKRGYYVFLLDYGWEEYIGEALYKNFGRMAAMASRNNAIVLQGTRGCHFADEVLSWYKINGQKGEEILPAILITTVHPKEIRENRDVAAEGKVLFNKNLILIPLRNVCTTSTSVADLINKKSSCC